MQHPYGYTHEYPIINVWLEDLEANNPNLPPRKFYCCVCGKAVFKYYSRVRMILPGIPPSEDTSGHPILVRCPGRYEVLGFGASRDSIPCKAEYQIN